MSACYCMRGHNSIILLQLFVFNHYILDNIVIAELPRKIDCTACGRRVNPAHGTICWHPCLNVLVCKVSV